MRLLFILLVVIFFGISNTFSQEKMKSYEVSAGLQIIKMKDGNFSPLNYRGTQFTPSLIFNIETPKFIDRTNYSFITGKINPISNSNIIHTISSFKGGSIDWIHVRKMNKLSSTKNKFFLGGVFNSSFSQYNRDKFYDDNYFFYQSSIGLAAHYRYPLNINNHKAAFESQFNFALISYALYPTFSTSMPENFLKKDYNERSFIDYILSGKIHTINKFQRINFLAFFIYDLNLKKALKINYNWELINTKRLSNYTLASHKITISLIFKK